MGCGGQGGARQVELPKNLTIFGHIMDSQTRSLMSICDKAGVKYIFNKIDTIAGDNKQSRYLSINPTGHIPMIEEGHFKVLGGNHIILIFLCKSKTIIGEKLMPSSDEQKVKGILGWYQAKMSTPGNQIYRMMYETKAFPSPPNHATYSRWKDDFLQCFKALDDKLISQPYLCSDKMSVGDIVVFNEIS